jgi:pilus assembly protein FimV
MANAMRKCKKVYEAQMRYKAVTLGLLLAGMSVGSASLTLGRARGAAWIGQPLQLIVPLQLDAGQDASAACAEADVFHAENKLDASRVNVAVEPTAQADTVNLRITSSTLIDEPVVTVYLRAGCTQKTTRRFVLLADYPTEISTPPAAVFTPPVVVVPAATTADTTARTADVAPAKGSGNRPTTTGETTRKPEVRAKVATPARAEPADKPVKPKPIAKDSAPAEKAETPKSKPESAAKVAGGERARLKLDPLENLAERIKTLEATTSTAPLEEMVRDSQRIQQLQSDVKALLDQAAKNEASLMAMRERLEKAESERVSATWIWLLGALVVASLGGLIALWSRRSEPSGWQRSIQEDATVQPTPHADALPGDAPAAPQQAVSPPSVRGSINSTMQMDLDEREQLQVDVNLMDMDSDFGKLLVPTQLQPPKDMTDFQTLKVPETKLAHRDFNGDPLNDVRQQAEFFEKLGKVDQAIDVLEQRIRSDSKNAPLLYLDLLQLSVEHNLKTDFRQFRDECENLYNVKIPEFALFRDEGRTLESYPTLLQHICKLWPNYSVLDVIEACVLRDPWEKNASPFELAAFKELILLHGIARSHLRSVESEQNPDAMDSSHIDIHM